jgi:hypothetical protein
MYTKHEVSIEPAYFGRELFKNKIKDGYTKEEIDAFLLSYYNKQETYSKKEVDNLIESIVLNNAIDDDQISSSLTWSSDKINKELLFKVEKEDVYNKEEVDGKIGTLGELGTTAKTDLVSAINEVRNSVSAGSTAAAIAIDTTTTTAGTLKSYTIKQGDNTIGTIDIPKDLVVTSGIVETNPFGQPEGTYIKLMIANQADPLYINVGSLVDLYTARADAAQVQLAIDNMSRKISATIVAGSITPTELAVNSVTTVKIADANVTLAKLADDVKNAFDEKGAALTVQTEANTYTDDKVTTINTTIKGIDNRIETVETAIENVATDDEISALFA